MKTMIVRYRVLVDRASENEAYIQKVFEQLVNEKPNGVGYNVYKLEDGISFMHIASIQTHRGKSPLASLTSFQAFVKEIEDRCEEPPVFSDATHIGSFKSIN